MHRVVGVHPFALALAVGGLHSQQQPGGGPPGDLGRQLVAQVFQRIGADPAVAVGLHVAVGVGHPQRAGAHVPQGCQVAAEGVGRGVVHRVPHLGVGVPHPVYYVASLAIVGVEAYRQPVRPPVGAGLGHGAVLRAQVGVGLLRGALVVEVGEGGQPVGAGHREVQCDRAEPQAGVGGQSVVGREARVLQSEGYRLQVPVAVGVVVAGEGRHAAPTVAFGVGRRQGAVGVAQHIAAYAFVAQFGAGHQFAYSQRHDGASAQPGQAAEVVVVAAVPRGCFGVAVAEQFETVAVQSAIGHGFGAQPAVAVQVGGRGSQGPRGLVLVGIAGAVEAVAAEGLALAAHLQQQVVVRGVPSGLHPQAAVAVVGVGTVAVAAVIGCGCGQTPVADAFGGQQRGVGGAVAAPAQQGRQPVGILVAHHQVDGAAEAHNAACHQRRRREQFDAFHHGNVDGQVEGVVAGLHVGQVHPVHHQHRLVEGASAQAQVGLCIAHSAGAHIDAWQQGYQVGEGMNVGLLDLFGGDNRSRLGRARQCVGREHYLHFGQRASLRLAVGLGGGGQGQHYQQGRCCSRFLEAAVGHACRQPPDGHLAVHRAVGRPPTTAEPLETVDCLV